VIATHVIARAACALAAWAVSTGVNDREGSAEPAPEADAENVEYRICRITAYCDRGVTASGVESGVGQCAAPGDIPFGATVYIPDLDLTLTVTDRTARRFRGNTVDIFMPDREECLDFGRQYLECHFIPPPDAPLSDAN
jgi:3D (Asp-Asp-Asp) domain-containing protein